MKPPSAVMIGPHRYTLTLAHSRPVRLSDGAEPSVGECDTKHCVITIDPDQSPTQLRDSVIHEILHGCMSLIGVTEDPGIDRDTEERIVLRLAPVLLQLVRQRPLVTWLQHDER